MKIKLTRAQWTALQGIVLHGAQAERDLGRPLEIKNSDQSIEITDDDIKIVLADNGE